MSDGINVGKSPYESGKGVAGVMGAHVSATRLLFLVSLARLQLTEGMLGDKVEDQQQKLDKMEDIRAALAVLRANCPTNDKDTNNLGTVTLKDGSTVPVADFLAANGIAFDSKGKTDPLNKLQFDAIIANCNGALDTLNGQSQIDMLSLQQQVSALDRDNSLSTNTLSKDGSMSTSIAQNMR